MQINSSLRACGVTWVVSLVKSQRVRVTCLHFEKPSTLSIPAVRLHYSADTYCPPYSSPRFCLTTQAYFKIHSIFILDLAVSFRTSTPDHHRAVTGEVEGGERGSVFSARCHRRAIVPRHRSRKREAAAFSPGAALPCRHHLSNGTLGKNHR